MLWGPLGIERSLVRNKKSKKEKTKGRSPIASVLGAFTQIGVVCLCPSPMAMIIVVVVVEEEEVVVVVVV